MRDVLQLGASARDARVAGAALLAAAAAASRRPGALADAVRDALVAQLARCKVSGGGMRARGRLSLRTFAG